MTESCRLITEEQYQEYQLLKKKLDIAVEALNQYANEENWYHCETEHDWVHWFKAMFNKDHYGYSKAQRALKEIEEVK